MTAFLSYFYHTNKTDTKMVSVLFLFQIKP